MLNTPSRLAQRLPAIAMLAAVMAISGCQKETEPTTPNQPTDTQRSDTETTAKTIKPIIFLFIIYI